LISNQQAVRIFLDGLLIHLTVQFGQLASEKAQKTPCIYDSLHTKINHLLSYPARFEELSLILLSEMYSYQYCPAKRAHSVLRSYSYIIMGES
jgi:hypothetical protein